MWQRMFPYTSSSICRKVAASRVSPRLTLGGRKCNYCLSVVAKANCIESGVADLSEHVRVVMPLLFFLLLTLSDYRYGVHVA
jgi:hypothetical protein